MNLKQKMEKLIQRFMIEQNNSWLKCFDELNTGVKKTDWIWYIIPQPFVLQYNTTPIRFAYCTADLQQALQKMNLLEHSVVFNEKQGVITVKCNIIYYTLHQFSLCYSYYTSYII